MAFTLNDGPDFKYGENRVWLEDDDGREIAFISFPYVGSGTKLVEIDHTVVLPEYGGQGLAAKLVREGVETIRKTNRRCTVTCSYAQAWFMKHTEYLFLLVDPEQAEELKDQT